MTSTRTSHRDVGSQWPEIMREAVKKHSTAKRYHDPRGRTCAYPSADGAIHGGGRLESDVLADNKALAQLGWVFVSGMTGILPAVYFWMNTP